MHITFIPNLLFSHYSHSIDVVYFLFFKNNNAAHNRPYVPPPIQQQRQQQVINNPPPVPSEPVGEANDNAEHAVPTRNQSFHSETRIFYSESDHTNGTDGYFIEHIAIAEFDKLPSQTMINPKNVSAITLRSGRQTNWQPLNQILLYKRSYLTPRTFWTLQVDDIHTIKTTKPPLCVCEYKVFELLPER
ncbi:hypothetical protein Lal_00014080 [Lupinus albus]|nr:hypothetical protein Lal_00014080 [Lupinus albus]